MTPRTQEYIEATHAEEKQKIKEYLNHLDEESLKKQNIILGAFQTLTDNDIDFHLIARPNTEKGFASYRNFGIKFENDKMSEESERRLSDVSQATNYFAFDRYYRAEAGKIYDENGKITPEDQQNCARIIGEFLLSDCAQYNQRFL